VSGKEKIERMFKKSTWLLLIIVAIFVLPLTLFTQNEDSPRSLYKKVDKLLQLKEYENAIPFIEQLIQTEPGNANFNFKMAYAIIRGDSPRDPMPYLVIAAKNTKASYKNKFSENAAPVDALWYIALQKLYTFDYEGAMPFFQEYLNVINNQHDNYNLCSEYIAACTSGPEIMANPLHVKIMDFSEATSIQTHIHSPLFSPDGSIFIYTADKNPEQNYYKIEHEAYNDDIFYVYLKDGKWSKPQSISSNINSSAREASVGIHPNGKQLLIFREDEYGIGNLYYSDLIDSSLWSPLKKFPAPINSNSNETHATISEDGKIIYFTSDREGGYGATDIYMSKLDEAGNWGPAVNLGPTINSEYFEESPHIQANSDLFYFSSNRPGGMGEFDVYRAELINDSIGQNVVNMGYPINSPQSDMFFKTTLDGGTAYYSSPCTSTNGELDIQIVQFLEKSLYPNVIVKGLVINEDLDTLKGHEITLFNMSVRDITDSARLDKRTGYYSFNLHSKNKYFASVEYDGYVYFSKPFQLTKYFADYSFQNVIELDPIYLTASTMRQNEGSFNVFKKRVITKDTSSISDTVVNMFESLDTIQTEVVSRTENVIDKEVKKEIVKQQVAVANKIEEPPVTDVEPEDVDTLPSNTDPIEVVAVTNVIQPEDIPVPEVIKPKTEPEVVNVSKPAVTIPKPAVKEPVVELDADAFLEKGITSQSKGEFEVSENDIQKALELFNQQDNIEKQIVCYDYLANAAYETGQLNNALELQKQSLDLIEKSEDVATLSQKKQEVALMYDELWYQDQAIDLFESSLETQKQLKNKDEVTELYFDIADVLSQHNEQEKAITYLEESLEFNTTKKKQAETYNRLGVSYHQLQNFTEAIEKYKLAIKTADEVGDLEGFALYQNNIGNAYFDIKEFDEAKIHYSISLGTHQKLANDRGIAVVLHNIGNVERKLANYTLAIDNYLESIKIANKSDNKDVLAKNYFALMQVYKIRNNHKLALEYYKKYFEISAPYAIGDMQQSQFMFKHVVSSDDVQLLQAKMKRTEELHKFEQLKYEKEEELLKQKENLLKVTQWALGIAFGGIVIVLILLLIRYRTRRRYYKQLSMQNAEILQQKEEITVQRENLEMLNVELEKLSIVASQTGNSVAILHGNTEVEFVNNAFLKQYSSQPKSFLEFATSEQEIQKINECLESKDSIQYETQRITANRHNLWVQCMLTPILIDNEIAKIIVIEADVTIQKENEIEIKNQRDEIQEQSYEIEQQRDVAINQRDEIETQKQSIEKSLSELQTTQKKLVESEKMASLGNLVAGISHEINTPVGIGVAATSSLVSRTESIKELFEAKQMKQSDLKAYLTSTQEAARLIQNNLKRTGDLVKSFKRVSVDEMTDKERTFKLKEYTQEVFTSLTGLIGERDLNISIDCPEDIEITTYPSAFSQIITNMLKNVLVYAYKPDEKGEIQIVARKVNDRLHFKFSDNGAGMTDEVVKKVFNPFFTTNMQAGMGLGMNLAYNVVTQKLHGEITCESSVGKGTSFLVDIPL